MKAGRELDALVAEKVMEWSSQADGLYWDAGNHGARLVLGSIIAKKRDEMGLENAHGFVFAPSTNIADAWEVVHKLREGNLWFVIKQDNSSGWEAKFWKGLPDGWFPTEEYYAVALTPALAICLAALKAKGVTGEQHG